MQSKVALSQIDEVVEKLFFELIAKTELSDDYSKIVNDIFRNLSEKYLSKFNQTTSDTAFSTFLQSSLRKYIALTLVTRILVSKHLWQDKLPSALVKTLATFAGLDIALVLNANALLIDLSRQLLEFKDSVKVIRALLNWNISYPLLQPMYVNVRLDKYNPTDLTKARIELEDFQKHSKILLPVSLDQLCKNAGQIGILSETLQNEKSKLKPLLLYTLKGHEIRTNFIAFLIRPLGQDLRVLASRQRRFLETIFLYASKYKNKTFYSRIFEKEFTILQAVAFYIALIELGRYLRQREQNIRTDSKTLVKMNSSTDLVDWTTLLKSELVHTVQIALVRRGWQPITAQKLAEVVVLYKNELQSIEEPDVLALFLIEHGDFTLIEQDKIIERKDELLQFVKFLELYANVFGMVEDTVNDERIRHIRRLPGVQTDKMISVELLADKELQNLLVSLKRLYQDQIIDTFTIVLTAEYFLSEITNALNLPSFFSFTLTDFISFDPDSVLTKIFSWLKPVFVNFLTLAIQLIGESSPLEVKVHDMYLDKLLQSVYDTKISFRYAQPYIAEEGICELSDFGNYVTSEIASLKSFKNAVSNNDARLYKELVANNLEAEKYERSIEQVPLDAFGAIYSEIQEDGLAGVRQLLGYANDYDGIDLFVLSEYDPQTKTFTLLRTDVPHVVYENE